MSSFYISKPFRLIHVTLMKTQAQWLSAGEAELPRDQEKEGTRTAASDGDAACLSAALSHCGKENPGVRLPWQPPLFPSHSS